MHCLVGMGAWNTSVQDTSISIQQRRSTTSVTTTVHGLELQWANHVTVISQTLFGTDSNLG